MADEVAELQLFVEIVKAGNLSAAARVPDLVAGTIVDCLNDFWCDEIDLFAICANRQHLFPRIRVFLDHVSATLPKMVQKESRISRQGSSPVSEPVRPQSKSQKIRRK
jgi:hypothetical protein